MAAIPENVRAVFESGRLAHLATINKDGTPHLTAVWVGVEGDEIVIGHMRDLQKLRNMRRNPNVSLSIETGEKDARNLDTYLVINGVATVTEGGAADVIQRVVQAYWGPGSRYPMSENPPPGYVTRITPLKFGGVGPWKE